MQALRIAASGMQAQQYNTEMIANNLANINTTGFQRQRAEFSDLIYKNVERKDSALSPIGNVVPGGVNQGLGVEMVSAYRIHEQGGLKQTEGNLDLAIQGNGFFQVLQPNGETAYTRDGSFQLNDAGELVTHDGYIVQPGINIPSDAISVTINPSGEVLVKQDGQTVEASVGIIELANFMNRGGLKAIGGNLYVQTASSGDAETAPPTQGGNGSIIQGFVEASNVNPIEEISALIRAQRAYEMNSKVITTASAIMATKSQQ